MCMREGASAIGSGDQQEANEAVLKHTHTHAYTYNPEYASLGLFPPKWCPAKLNTLNIYEAHAVCAWNAHTHTHPMAKCSHSLSAARPEWILAETTFHRENVFYECTSRCVRFYRQCHDATQAYTHTQSRTRIHTQRQAVRKCLIKYYPL